ncbi:quaternary ammonium compound efflux SMR transporter SugE [Thermoactinomyces mirandus]|uniref:Quaternary ammonium compound efflux SMR transporter SugE n=1 Tax=Thermoactinomyces mirandus TaxID=2756294 RepID=A0A7W2ARY3_9BACL|nr:quaternary ammonium compound efflux SMR transporter SugE [Thermoactinomyces mirandus]MBA4602105.1 quaternary ammonium compound efflux SMR transporter SugE [Thermoactinomyces mirandus]
MAWIYLFIAGIFEVVWAISLKYTHGFTRFYPSLLTLAGMVVSFYFLSQATKQLPIGTAYAVWTGIGVLGTAILGIILFHESRHWLRLLFLCMILTGIAGLKLASASQ